MVKGWVSDFFIVIFEFCVPKLVSVPIFRLFGVLFNFEGWGGGGVLGWGIVFTGV